MEKTPQVGKVCSNNFFGYHEGIILVAEEGFNPSRKYTYNNKNILTTHPECQLNEVQMHGLKGAQREEAWELKTVFPGGYGPNRSNMAGKLFL